LKRTAISFLSRKRSRQDYFRALHNYLLHYARDAYEEFEARNRLTSTPSTS